jgi:hypothetical protein
MGRHIIGRVSALPPGERIIMESRVARSGY